MDEKAIPHPMNYADLKPQSVDSMMRFAKFTPTATIGKHPNQQPIKFMINDNGFWDPYNTFIKIRVQPKSLLTGEIKRLDHSAHSLFKTMIVRVAGQEIERLDNYALWASIMNDLSYSTEQRNAHFYEGFGNIKQSQLVRSHANSIPFTVDATHTFLIP